MENIIKTPCWAYAKLIESDQLIICTYVTNEQDVEQAQSRYLEMFGDSVVFGLSKEEPFVGW